MQFTDKHFPYILYFTDDLPVNVGGQAKGFIIKIKNKHRNDLGILKHEEEHVNQFWQHGLLIHMLRYTYNEIYRFQSEVESYKCQLKYPPASLNVEEYISIFAGRIANDYGIGISENGAEKALLEVDKS
jgi:hypothetical protein